MKAVYLEKLGGTLEVKTLEKPKLCGGGVLVKPVYSYILNFAPLVFGGKTPLKAPVPFIPGCACVGYVEEVADDVLGIEKDMVVFCSPWMQSQVNNLNVPQDGLIQGWFATSPTSEKLTKKWKNGAWAETMLTSHKNVYPLPNECKKMLKDCAMINWYCIALGAIKTAGNMMGKTVMVNGSTGQLGRCVVHLSLALGASKVYCVGRDVEKLKKAFGEYSDSPLEFVTMDKLPQYACDYIFDFLGLVPTGEFTEKSLASLKNGGTIIFGGGVYGPVTLNYGEILGRQLQIKGTLMYGPKVPNEVIMLIKDGKLKLPKREFYTYPLEKVNDGVNDAFKNNKRICLMKMNDEKE